MARPEEAAPRNDEITRSSGARTDRSPSVDGGDHPAVVAKEAAGFVHACVKIVALSSGLTRGVNRRPRVISQAEDRRKRAPTFFRNPHVASLGLRRCGDGRVTVGGILD